MSAPSLAVLAIQAEQIRRQVLALHGHIVNDNAHAYEAGLLVAMEVLVGQVAAGLRLSSDPVLLAETKARLDSHRMAAVASDPRS